MLKELLTECLTLWRLRFKQRKNLEDSSVSQYLIRKCLLIKSPVFILPSFVSIALILFLSIQNAYSVDITFRWEKSTQKGISGYRIFCRENGKNYNYDKPVWEGTGTTCTIPGFIENKIYFFVVRSFHINGAESENSNEICFLPLNEKNRINIQIYNKYTGSWLSRYIFFKKLCGKDILFNDMEFFFYSGNGRILTRYLQ